MPTSRVCYGNMTHRRVQAEPRHVLGIWDAAKLPARMRHVTATRPDDPTRRHSSAVGRLDIGIRAVVPLDLSFRCLHDECRAGVCRQDEWRGCLKLGSRGRTCRPPDDDPIQGRNSNGGMDMSKDQAILILKGLNDICVDYDPSQYGLPMLD